MNKSIHHLHRMNTLHEYDINKEKVVKDLVESARLPPSRNLDISTTSSGKVES